MPSAHQRAPRLAVALAWLLVVALLAGCSGGTSDGAEIGGGSGGGLSGGTGNPPPPDPPPDPGTEPTPVLSLMATLSWAAASGPVAGYRVLVSRNDGAFAAETQTSVPSVVVSGAQGDVVRVRVAAFDAQGNTGPLSNPSKPFVFVGTQSSAAAASSTSSELAQTADALAVASGTTSTASTADSGDEAATTSTSRGDLFGAGADDLVWESSDGTLVRVTSADLGEARIYALPAGGWRIAAVGDFDADGVADLLFAAPGELALAPGTALRAGPGELALETWAQLPAAAEFSAAGDFDGDGGTDAVVLEGGAASLWLAAGDVVALPAAAPGSLLAGASDADGDGSDDLLWAGAEGFSLWRVVAGALSEVTAVAGIDGAGFVAFADFDGDASAELALRTAPDAIALERPLAPSQGWQEPAPSGASLAGCGDYDGDGSRDRLWADAESLRIVSAAGEQVVALDAASPWRLVPDCH